jgi:predicted nuclease of predicted toxin-antitoxin system
VVDEDMPRSAAKLLREKGHEVIDVRDAGLRGRPDKDILAFARERKATVITCDVGFAGYSHAEATSHYGLMLVRVPNEWPVSRLNKLLLAALAQLEAEDLTDAVVVVQPDKIRIRRKARDSR